MAKFIDIQHKDNNTPLTPAEFNYLIDKLNSMKMQNLVDTEDTNPSDGDIWIHNGSGFVLIKASQVVGGAAGSGDLSYTHNQGTSDAVWYINHNLNKFPSVSVKDSAGTEVQGLVQHVDMNNVTVSFNTPFKGIAFLN